LSLQESSGDESPCHAVFSISYRLQPRSLIAKQHRTTNSVLGRDKHTAREKRLIVSVSDVSITRYNKETSMFSTSNLVENISTIMTVIN
jgi:hypothetical protein